MPNRKAERRDIIIGEYEISIYSKGDTDFTRYIEKPSEKYSGGILIADPTGHEKKLKKILLQRISKLEKLFKPPWYSQKDARESLKEFSQQIRKKGSRITEVQNKIESTCMAYCLLENFSINYSNAALRPPIHIIENGELVTLAEEAMPPIGFIKKAIKEGKGLNQLHLKKGESILFYTDGLKENPPISEIVTKRIKEKEKTKIPFPMNKMKEIAYPRMETEKELTKYIEKNQNIKDSELEHILKSKIDLKKRKSEIIKKDSKEFDEEIKRIQNENKEYKRQLDFRMSSVQEEVTKEFEEKFKKTIKENYTKSAKEIRECIINEVGEYFNPTKKHHDDITFIVLKRKVA